MSVIYKPENFEDFNGVLFLLKESHANEQDKGDEETVTLGAREWYKQKVLAQGSTCRYKKRFCEMLAHISLDESELQNAAYDNLYRLGGDAKSSKEYSTCLKDYERKDFDALMKELRNKVRYIFTCKNIYNKLKAMLNGQGNENSNGLQYKSKILPYFESDEEITVYQIDHPSRGSRIYTKK